jgi:hypothetical protein
MSIIDVGRRLGDAIDPCHLSRSTWSQRSFFFKKKQFFFEKFERDLNFQENTVVSSARAATTPPTAYAACLLDGCWFSEPAARSLAHVQKLCGRRRHTQSACPAAGRRQAGRPG